MSNQFYSSLYHVQGTLACLLDFKITSLIIAFGLTYSIDE